MYHYGKEISYDYALLKVEDFDSLQPFACKNEVLDEHIHTKLIEDNQVNNEDGLYFRYFDTQNQNTIAIVSLAASGILFRMSNFTQTLPAIKIDILAADKNYQKIHYDEDSEKATDSSEHYYFMDDIMGTIINHIRRISEEFALVEYIILYAAKDAYHFYERNGFSDYTEYMEAECNQKIRDNIPMFFKL